MTKKQAKKSNAGTGVKILVFVDDNEYSRVALRYACHKAKVKKAPVEMLCVINPQDFNSLFSVSEVMLKEKKKEVRKLLKEMADDVKSWAGIVPSISVREGGVVEEIIAYIEEDHDIDMLVMSSSPAPTSGGAKLISAIIEELDDKLQIPVVIVPANLTDQQIEELV